MRNYELIKEIYEICQTADYRDEGHVVPEIIADLIEKERPEMKEGRCSTPSKEFRDGIDDVIAATGCDYGIGG